MIVATLQYLSSWQEFSTFSVHYRSNHVSRQALQQHQRDGETAEHNHVFGSIISETIGLHLPKTAFQHQSELFEHLPSNYYLFVNASPSMPLLVPK